VRRQAASELRTERLRLEQTIQQLPAGVMLAEAPSGRIVLANALASEILGEPPSQAGLTEPVGLPPGLPTDQAPPATGGWPLARAIHAQESVRDEDVPYLTPAGRRLTLRLSAAPLRDEQGDVFAGVAVFQDVSERVRSERLLAGQRDVMSLIATGEPLERTLDAIARCAEEISQYGARASIMLLSPDGRRLHRAAAPSLPDSFVATIRADDGRPVGTFTVYYDRPRAPDDDERRVVELLADTAGVAIARARDAEQRARQLHDLQGSLLPRELPKVPGLQAAAGFHPGDRGLDVGGDFYDVFALPDGAWGVVIGDVCGHGAGAAAVTALTRHTTRAIARLETRPAKVLEVVNDALRHSDYGRFCTAVFGRVEADRGRVRIELARGGHPAPLVRRAGGEVEPVPGHGPLLGVFADARFPETTVELAPDDAMLLYTDGVIERNPRVAGVAQLRTLLAALPRGDAADLLAGLERRAVGDPRQLRDDAALLVLQAG
jgi:serine phosphatase RsbU (regulator of sigma subunit)